MGSRAEAVTAQQKLFEVEQVTLTLNDRFLVPPFSALDARAGYWQNRKRDWLTLGIKSELGRDAGLLGFESFTSDAGECPTCGGKGLSMETGKKCHNCGGTGIQYGKRGGHQTMHTTSVFDPVLCEVVYRWFCPEGGTVLDPFAGGSVRGIVAGALGRGYLGVDLRLEQVESNYVQQKVIGARHRLEPLPEWVVADSRTLPEVVGGHKFDALFTCPPYYDLEQYSDDPRDLSNAGSYADFSTAHYEIIHHAVAALHTDSFAVWVVGEVRGKDGHYVGLVPHTIHAFERAGCQFYNEAILLTMLGTAPVRVSSQFGGGRKLGKVHQNVLVFVKGDAKRAAAKVPVEEVAVESGGAVWRADATAEVPATGEVDLFDGEA